MTHRAPPPGRHIMTMRWLSLAFIHWRVDAGQLRPLIPEPLEIDTVEGSAWVGLVPFTMRDVRHRFRLGVPAATHFHECNVRTYVTCDGEPGVWFLSLDAASRCAVRGARTLWNLPYFYSNIELENHGDTIRYAVDRRDRPRASMQITWRPDAPREPAPPGSLVHALTERYCLYSTSKRGRVRRSRIHHEPWPLRDADVIELDDGLIRAAGLDVDTDIESNPPLIWHADALDVRVWRLATV